MQCNIEELTMEQVIAMYQHGFTFVINDGLILDLCWEGN